MLPQSGRIVGAEALLLLKVADDKTFGLKNKNKSSKVQT